MVPSAEHIICHFVVYIRCYNILTTCTYSVALHLRRSRPQLHTMPLRKPFLQYLIHQLMLLDPRQTLKLRLLNLDCIHGAAATADVLDLEKGQRTIHTASHVAS